MTRPAGYTAYGRDISYAQTEFPPVEDFVFVRACYGTDEDTKWAQWSSLAAASGRPWGAYLFLRPDQPTSLQVAAFLALIKGKTRWLFLDVEAQPRINVPAASPQSAADAVTLIHKAGYRIGLYHSESGYFDAGQDWRFVAWWNPGPPPIPWDVWQYGSDGGVDGDVFRGTIAQLRALAEVDPDMPIYARGGVNVADLPSGTPYYDEPGDTTSAGTTSVSRTYLIGPWTKDFSRVAVDGTYQSAFGTTPTAQGWVDASKLQNVRAFASPPAPVTDLSLVSAALASLGTKLDGVSALLTSVGANVAAIRTKTDRDLS